MKRQIKDFLKRQLATVFHVGQRFGLDILPRHFYSEIPDMRRLRATEHWREPFSMRGIAGWDADEQLRFVQAAMNEDTRRALAARDIFTEACHANEATGYGPIESDFLYAVVRQHRPQRIVQVGSGISTYICLSAAEDAGYRAEITCIDPFPNEFLLKAKSAGRIDLIPAPVETLDLSFLSSLSAGDLFFVDSTHTLGPGGEVTRIIVEMLPRLAAGVRIHFHDIYFPYDFDPRIMDRLFFWHETALLLAFLCGNDRFRVCTSLSLMHYERQGELRRLFPRYNPMQIERGVRVRDGHFPNSLYLEIVK